MRMSHSEYRPIPMSTREVLQSTALLKTMRFDACAYTLNVNLNGLAVSIPKCAIITVLIITDAAFDFAVKFGMGIIFVE